MITQSIRRTSILVGLLALLGAVFASTSSAKQQDTDPYIVVFKDSVSAPANLAKTQTENRDADLGFIYRHAAKGYSAELTKAEVEGLREDARVDFVSRDHELELFAQLTPTGIDRVFATSNEALDIDEEDDVRVDADVAVIDTGTASHPDLNIVGRTDCTVKEGETYKCVDNTGSDFFGHGTHVAGTVGALDNDKGVVGVAPGARLWSVRIISPSQIGGKTLESRALAGVDWVTAHSDEIEVANMSFGCAQGSEGGCTGTPALKGAITEGVEAGVVFVAAAGNDNTDASKTHPASHPDVIAVSALSDSDGSPNEGIDPLASFSNYGSTVEVAAPGVNIASTVPGGYGADSGTSMASPHVAGAAAILAAKDNPETAEDVEEIRDTILEEGNSDWMDKSPDGIKEPLLDVSNEAVFNLIPEPDVATEEATKVTLGGATLNATVNPNGLATTYQFEYGKTKSYGSKVPLSPEAIGSGTEGVKVDELIEGLEPNTTYHFRVAAENEGGVNTGADRTFTTKPLTKPGVGTPWATEDENWLTRTMRIYIDPNESSTTYQFEYGKTTSYGTKAPASPKSIGVKAGFVSEPTEVLQPDTTYHYRVAATNVAGTTYSEDKTFTTIAVPTTSTPPKLTFSVEHEFEETYLPIGVAADPEGNVWVVDNQMPQAHKLDEEGNYLTTTSFESEADNSEHTRGIATDSEGNILIGQPVLGFVQKFNTEGEHLIQIGDGWGEGNGEFQGVQGIAVDSEDDIWVLDAGGQRVQQFDAGGEYLSQFEVGEAGLTWPQGIAIDPEGDIWIVGGSDDVHEFDSEGEALSDFDPGSGWPTAIAVDATGTVWVVNGPQCKIEAFDPEGELLTDFGSCGSVAPNRYGGELGLGVDPGGNVWVADLDGRRVVKWVRGGSMPTATTQAATEVGEEKATLNGVVNPEGGATSYRFEYGKTTSYGTSVPAPDQSLGYGEANINVDEPLSGLSPKTTYHYRVVATNASGTTYGADKTFYTGPAPVAATEAATELKRVRATLRGAVDPEGSATTYQFEYGKTTSYGTKAPASPKAIGSGTSSVEVKKQIAGLEPGTTYHFRVVATSAGGTSYGTDKTFTTLSEEAGVWLAGEGSEVEAEQPRFESDDYSSTQFFTGWSSELAIEIAGFDCSNAYFYSQPPSATATLPFPLYFQECTNSYGGPLGYEANTCDYTLSVQNAGPPYTGTFGVACEEGGDEIVFKAYTDHKKTTIACEAKLGAQEIEGIDLANVGGAMERKIEMQADVEDIEYEISGPCVGAPEIRTDGTLTGEMLIEGTEE